MISVELSSQSFLVDGMLGTLATKLRILGFDTVYENHADDKELLRQAEESRRILLTSDNELFLQASRLRLKVMLIKEGTEKERLVTVLKKIGIDSVSESPLSRCSACNGSLRISGTDSRGRRNYVCSECGKRYWRGSHWKKLGQLFAEVNGSLSKDSN
jgi:uncharacterized protein